MSLPLRNTTSELEQSKPRLAIVCSHNISCATAYYALALRDFLMAIFDVEIIDLKSLELLQKEGESYRVKSENYIDEICLKLQEFDVVNLHCELGLFGTSEKDIIPRILRISQASKRLIMTMHRLDIDQEKPGHAAVYSKILQSLKQRLASNPFHILVHLPRERGWINILYDIEHVTDFPVIFLTNKRREFFQKKRNPTQWKKQFSLKESDKTIGIFGLLSPYKSYSHALRLLRLLPVQYKLMIIGETAPSRIREWQIDPVIQEITSYLDTHPELADRVIFTGRRDDEQFNEDLANIDFALLPYFEVGQSASAALSNILEMGCATVMSNTFNCKEYQTYFPDCFEVFDIGNYYEAKNKILNFDQNKLLNLKKRLDLYSEVQIQQIYDGIYKSMKSI
jgi:hypothetical protein